MLKYIITNIYKANNYQLITYYLAVCYLLRIQQTLWNTTFNINTPNPSNKLSMKINFLLNLTNYFLVLDQNLWIEYTKLNHYKGVTLFQSCVILLLNIYQLKQ